MRILVSGSSGLVGSALVPALEQSGHRVARLVRARSEAAGVFWDPEKGQVDPAGFEGAEALIHLAGENIASGRWTAAKKERIRESRVRGTSLLAETLARLERPPKTWLCASAVGFYGDRKSELLQEDAAAGAGFLAEVCRAWETAAAPAAQRGIRVAHLRFGVVLSPQGGALAQMLLPFKLGVGGRVGDGRQYMSWIALDDAIGAIAHALSAGSLSGPVNVVTPRPVTNQEFARTLGRVLGRPAVFPLPAAAARFIFGELAEAVLLSSQRVEPAKLLQSGYPFRYPELEGALRHLLKP